MIFGLIILDESKFYDIKSLVGTLSGALIALLGVWCINQKNDHFHIDFDDSNFKSISDSNVQIECLMEKLKEISTSSQVSDSTRSNTMTTVSEIELATNYKSALVHPQQ